jgi:hypothetical protein
MRRVRPLLGCVTALAVLLLGAADGLRGRGAAEAGGAEVPPGVPDEKTKKAIDAAVEKGAAWLRGQQAPDGSFGGITTKAGVRFEIGLTSLVGLALLAESEGKPDPAADRALAYCRTTDLARAMGRATYDTGVLLMFATEHVRSRPAQDPPRKGGRARKEDKDAKDADACRLPDDVRVWVQALVEHLVASRKEPGTWGYPMYDDDHSNTQYAFLGLRAARDCGAAVPEAVFERAVHTILARQEKDGPKVMRKVPSTKPGERSYGMDSGDRARGWRYRDPFTVTGSMTTAAIAILAIANDALLRPVRAAGYTPQLERDVQRSVQDGFAWLDHRWTVDRNPGDNAIDWHLYHLYGLERACVFGGRDLVGDHDWYLEGAAKLLAMQRGDGRWGTGWKGVEHYEASDLADTAWAILFLKKATRPLPPIRAPVVTPGG